MEGKVTVPEPDATVKLVVDAPILNVENALAPAPRNSMLLRAFEPTKVPPQHREIDCDALVLLNIVVPLLCVKVPPLLLRFPAIDKYVAGAVIVPAAIMKSFVVVAALAPNVHDPPVPLNRSAPKEEEVAIIFFC